jgi:signal transduction histidine kinase
MVDPATVLVVDDNAENRALARDTLESDGYRVIVARDGEQAVELAATTPPDCIVMDVRMPVVDGITACRRVRAQPGGDAIAIIFVTAQRDVETFDRALAAGGDDFLTKPFRPSELVVRVQTAMRLRRLAVERRTLYAEIKQQRDAMQRLELQKEQLVAFLVHDLKNPVNAIELQAQTIERAGDDTARVRRAAGTIREETRALLRLITNLLDVARADEGQLVPVPAPVDLHALVDTVVAELAPSAARARVTIVKAVDAPVARCDRDLIARVLANLLDNALRHAPEDSEVRVAVAAASGGIELRVSDRGPGIPQEMRETVFERFRSGDLTTRTNRGLGLAFCKLAVEAHRGRIQIEGDPPGATFCVMLPDA